MDGGYRELHSSLDYLEKLSKEDPVLLKKRVYETFSGLSVILLEAKKSKFKRGWTSNILDRHGSPLFDKKESYIIEDGVKKFIKPLFTDKQRGGVDTKGPAQREAGQSSIIQPTIPVSLDDLSIDKTFWKIKDFFSLVDAQMKTFSRELGPFRLFYTMETDFQFPLPVPIPAPPFVTTVMVPVNPRAIPIIISLIIESIRIIFSIGPLSNEQTRKVLSLVLGLVDILKGDWKQGILSIIGFFGEAPLVAGLILKVLLNIMDFVSPDLQEKLVMNLYQSGKSIIIGFILWGFSNFAPDFARAAARAQFDILKKMVDQGNETIDKLEESIQKSVEPAGLKIKFKDIPEGFVPTFDDIQNLQSIVRQPSIYCSKEFQQVLEPLRKLPPIRLVLELMNLPTDPQTLEFECKEKAGESLEDTVGSLAEPEVTMNPDSPIMKALEEKAEEKPEEKPEEKVEEKPEEKVEEKVEEKPEEKPEEKAEEKPEEKIEEKPEEKPEEKVEEKPEEKAEEKVEEKVEEKLEEKNEGKAEEKVEEKIEEKPEEKAEEKVEEKPEEKAEVKPEEKPEGNPIEEKSAEVNPTKSSQPKRMTRKKLIKKKPRFVI